jgi:SAM-dependent methyltransferase
MDLERSDAYGRSFGDVYDLWYDGVTDAAATARFVARHHPGGLVLELGMGTGRLADPMAAVGLTVVGLDASPDMLARHVRRPGIHPVLADMRALPFGPGRSSTSTPSSTSTRYPFGTVLVAFNTLFNLTRSGDQAALLAEVAGLVEPAGTVIVEILDVSALLDGPDRAIGLRRAEVDPLVVTSTRLDRPTQRLVGQHLEITDEGLSLRPWLLRWVTPDQLDALAESAGLQAEDRHGSWDGAPARPGDPAVIARYRPRPRPRRT